MARTYQPKFLPGGELNPKYKPKRNKQRGKYRSKYELGDFIAWDGEGITDDSGEHKYIMLCSSSPDIPSLVDSNGLGTRQLLEHMLDAVERHPNAIHVAFGASYDVNMILADCSRDEIKSIWAGAWTFICDGTFSVCYRARKSFSVRRVKARYKNIGGKLKRVDQAGLVLWDVFGFFQSSFVVACEKYLGADYPELAFVAKQKQKRRKFKTSQLRTIERYCLIECSMLLALMRKLKEYLDFAELPIRRWDGAGACAASLLMRERVTEHKQVAQSAVQLAAQHAYAGGRMELARYGHAPGTPIFHYDINSAYPTAMCTLPSLAGGQWIKGDGSYRPELPFSLYRIAWSFGDCAMYPFFWRAFDCSIFYPDKGQGWYWTPDIEAAQQALDSGVLQGTIVPLESWHFIPASDEKPFAFLPPLYEQRKQWKSAGIGAEKVLKLAINSLYGKTAQQAGGTLGSPPKYHQLEWSGYITSFTRAMLYRAMLPAIATRDVIMCATDGIYSLVPLELETGDELGQWEYKQHDGITVVQSGVYWTHENGELPNPFCRGFDKGSLRIERIVAAWKRRQVTYDASLTRFVTMGSALAGLKSFKHWRSWRTMPRELSLTTESTKRFDELGAHEWTRAYGPHCALVHTHAAVPAAQLLGQRESAKYPLLWDTDDDDERDVLLDGAPLRLIEQEAYDSEL